MAAIYVNDLVVLHSPTSGYQTTWPTFVDASRPSNGNGSSKQQGGSARVQYDVDNLVDILWPVVNQSTITVAGNMLPLLRRLGASNDEISPFCRDFGTREELLGAYTNNFSGSKVFVNNTSDQTPGEADDTVNGDGEEGTDVTVGDNGNIEHMQEAIDAALADEEE